uniref:At1g61320/AtMIF1 LRR domain-containing protein n=1 Tax=Oryza nivara TaxID=4536 RepID=A0A0E0HVF1_ORYNI
MPLRDAARASLVSRNWRMLWTCHPNLCFDGTKQEPTDEGTLKINRWYFSKTVNHVVRRHKGIGLNKFSINCDLNKDEFKHIDGKDVNLQSRHRNRWPTRKHLLEDVYHFSLDALDAKHDPALESLFLAVVSIEVHPNISGFTMLKRLALQYVKLVGDLPDLLSRCSLLEDLDISVCTGVGDLVIPCQLDKLQHLRIWGTEVQMIEFHVSCLTRFGYRGEAISIMLHGCPKSVKATIVFLELNQLDHVFTVLPSALPVKELSLDLHMYDYDLGQVHTLTRPRNMFMHLRHLKCEVYVLTSAPNTCKGVVQLAHYLEFTPLLEVLEWHMYYYKKYKCRVRKTKVAREDYRLSRHDHLKTVYMSGFRCYRPQEELVYFILENAVALEFMSIEPHTILADDDHCDFSDIAEYKKIRKWARRTSACFGKQVQVKKKKLAQYFTM